jgi:hypothetical protein
MCVQVSAFAELSAPVHHGDEVTELGGTLLTAPEDTPYGRLATIANPDGAVFKLTAACGLMPGARS